MFLLSWAHAVTLIMVFYEAHSNQWSTYPLCANISYNENSLDIENTLYSCAKNIPGSLEPPSYYPTIYGGNYYTATNVSLQLVVNNLLSVDDIGTQINLDLFLRLRL